MTFCCNVALGDSKFLAWILWRQGSGEQKSYELWGYTSSFVIVAHKRTVRGVSPSEMLLGNICHSEGNGAVLLLIYFDFPLRNKLLVYLQSKGKRPLNCLNSEKSCASLQLHTVSSSGKGTKGLEREAQRTRTRWLWWRKHPRHTYTSHLEMRAQYWSWPLHSSLGFVLRPLQVDVPGLLPSMLRKWRTTPLLWNAKGYAIGKGG